MRLPASVCGSARAEPPVEKQKGRGASKRRTILVALLLAVPGLTVAQTTGAARTPWGHPDLQGIWDQTTGTPLERSTDLADREFLTEEEAVARETRRFRAFDAAPRPGSPGNYGGSPDRSGVTGRATHSREPRRLSIRQMDGFRL